MKFGQIVIGAALVATTASAALVEREETYTDGTLSMRGFIVYDDAVEGLRPGVLVVHELWGQNEYVRRRARMLAEQGYIAMAVDLYGEGKASEHPKEASEFASAVLANMQLGVSRLRAARALLDVQPQTDPAREAAIGYCLGGAAVLHMARAGEDLALVASFHGVLATLTPARRGVVKSRVLVYHGAADIVVPEADVQTFEQEMKSAEVDYKLTSYPDAKHGFTVPEADERAAKYDLPVAYDAEADQASWQDLLNELKAAFLQKTASK